MKGRVAELETVAVDDVIVARVDGEIDTSNAREIALALTAKLPPEALGLVLDLSAVSYLDSSGVQLLFDLAARLRRRDQFLRLVVPDAAPIKRVLELCALDSVAPIDADAADALQAMREWSS